MDVCVKYEKLKGHTTRGERGLRHKGERQSRARTASPEQSNSDERMERRLARWCMFLLPLLHVMAESWKSRGNRVLGGGGSQAPWVEMHHVEDAPTTNAHHPEDPVPLLLTTSPPACPFRRPLRIARRVQYDDLDRRQVQ